MIRALCLVLIATHTLSFAYVKRLAIVIGNNEGLEHERFLKYAEHDAMDMSRVLQNIGSFEKDRLYTLVNSDVQTVQKTINEVSGRIKELKKSDGKILVLVYFSGHGSAEALHIKGEKFKKESLLNQFEGLEADMKLLIVDACESGDLIRSKGGRVIKDYVIKKEDRLHNKGAVILTSSSKGELAQESEDYRGAVFTHHFLNGLRGLADYNNDKEITLWESFQYASIGTRSENIMGKTESQTPNFDVDVVGKGDLVLTSLHHKQGRILFKGFPNTAVNIYDAANMRLEARLLLSGRDSVYYTLLQKKHLITIEGRKEYKVAKIDLYRHPSSTITPNSFKTYSRSEVNRKGGSVITLNPNVLAVGSSYEVIASGSSIPIFQFTYGYLSGNFRHSLTWGIGFNSEYGIRKELIEKKINQFRYEIKKPIWRMRFAQILLGADAGVCLINQHLIDRRFEGTIGEYRGDENPSKKTRALVYELGLPMETEMFLFYGLALSLQGQVSVQGFKNTQGKFTWKPGYFPSMKVGYRF